MKMLRISLLLILISCLIGYSETDVQFTFANGQYNISQYTNVTVMLQPEQMNVSGSTTLLPGAIYQTTDTNASTTFSNLYGSYSGGYYHWRVISFSNPSGTGPIPAQGNQGDIQVTSTNLGLINSTALGIVFVPVYSGSGAANTVQASDLRYAPIGGIIATNISNATGTNVNLSGSFTDTNGAPLIANNFDTNGTAAALGNSTPASMTNANNVFAGNGIALQNSYVGYFTNSFIIQTNCYGTTWTNTPFVFNLSQGKWKLSEDLYLTSPGTVAPGYSSCFQSTTQYSMLSFIKRGQSASSFIYNTLTQNSNSTNLLMSSDNSTYTAFLGSACGVVQVTSNTTFTLCVQQQNGPATNTISIQPGSYVTLQYMGQ